MLKFQTNESESERHERNTGLFLAVSESSASVCRWTMSGLSTSVTPLLRLPESAPIKCVDWSTLRNNENLFAFGASTGRIATCRYFDQFDDTKDEPSTLNVGSGHVKVVAEYIAKPVRSSVLVSFNKVNNLLVAGLGKYRNEACCLVWDTATAAIVAQLGSSEALSSSAWLTASSFLAGIASKWIRIYDLRRTSTATMANDNNNAAQVVIATRFVNGLTVDPFDDRRFASYADGANGGVSIWDVRKTAVPVLSLEAGVVTGLRGGVSGLEWCPTRPGVLAACGKDGGGVVQVWELQESIDTSLGTPFMPSGVLGYTVGASVSSRSATPPAPPFIAPLETQNAIPQTPSSDRTIPVLVNERRLKPATASDASLSAPSSSLAWVPLNPLSQAAADILIQLNLEDGTIRTNTLMHTPKVSWSAHAGSGAGSGLAAAFGKNIHLKNIGGGSEWDNDMASVMKKRAMDGYALDAKSNISLLQRKIYAESSQQLIEIWGLLGEFKSQARSNSHNANDNSLLGISQILKEATRKASLLSPLVTVSTDRSIMAYFKPIESEARSMGLRMCGRLFESEASLELQLQTFEQMAQFEQAAGFALFYSLSLNRALRSLNASKDDKLKLVAAALAGYTAGTASTEWTSVCQNLSMELKDPFLRCLFCLMAHDGNWNRVLEIMAEGLHLHDRIGIALRFLPDSELLEYVKTLEERLIREGGVRGLIVTGFVTKNGVDLLENYVDVTGDFQSAALISVSVRNGTMGTDERVSVWFENYRNILDQWELFHERATLDIAKGKLARSNAPPSTPTHASSKQQQQQQFQELEYSFQPSIGPHIHVRCNFCNTPISQTATLAASAGPLNSTSASSASKKSIITNTGGGASGGGGGNPSACPHCRKPLPRCALCLMHMGPLPASENHVNGPGVLLKGFGSWFTWCQTCRHGGHAVHVQEWFKGHSECMVAGCGCACL